MWLFRLPSTRVTHRLLFPLALAVALIGGLAGCDSGGTVSGNGENENGNGSGDEVAKTFTVTVEDIDDSYPYSDQNNVGVAYAIDGEVGAEITLERGATYAFELEASVDEGPNGFPHPFYVGTTAEGQGGDEYDDGVDNAKATTGTVLFTPPTSAPDSLFYQCDNHVFMGGKMMIDDASN